MAYTDDQHIAMQAVNSQRFKSMTKIGRNLYEIVMGKKQIALQLPIFVGFQILARAKVKQLAFTYDFLNKYLMKEHFSLTLTDTDSIGIQYSTQTMEQCVHPHLLQEYRRHIYGNCTDKENEDAFLIRDCCSTHRIRDQRTPGVYKKEAGDNAMCIALSSKCYYLKSQENESKLRAKGVKAPSSNIKDPEQAFRMVMENHQRQTCVNRGFRFLKQEMRTYELTKTALSFAYKKREVLPPEGIYTKTIDLLLNPLPQNYICIVTQTPALSPTCTLQCGWFKYGHFTFHSIMHAILIFKCFKMTEGVCYNTVLPQIKQLLELSSEEQLINMYNKMISNEQWERELEDLTEKFIRERLVQNPDLQNQLKQHKGKPFLYATQYSSILGNGSNHKLTRYHKAAAFAGHNLIGRIYTKIRDE